MRTPTGVCTTLVGRWLTQATSDHVEDRDAIGLFPAHDDLTYRCLVSAWAQLRAFALTDAVVDERVEAMLPVLRDGVRDLFGQRDRPNPTAVWVCLEGLRAELIRPGSELTPADAPAFLEQS